jgi:dTDP-4-amino-4,6-dideoxygalactose transaminase
MNVPFLDLKTPHIELEDKLVSVFRDCIRNASFVGGSQVESFEQEFAQFCESKYCIAVNSGTDALRFALMAAGIGPGDEVITVPNTFIATTEAISQTGASIAFVDIDEKTYNMDPSKLEECLKSRYALPVLRSPATWAKDGCSMRSANRPKAIIPVHLYGQPADMDAIREIAERYGLIVIEDACQAHGALYYSRKEERWKKAGSMGLAAAFSFYPGKNLGACGEGGAVTTSDEEIARKIRMLRDHGQAKKYYHAFEGYNGRLDAIQCGLLRIKLKKLPDWNDKRRQNATLYNELLNTAAPQHSSTATLDSTSNPKNSLTRNPELLPAGAWAQEGATRNITTPYEPSWSKSVYHLYIVRTPKRDELQKYLSENGIGTGLHYPIPLHLQDAYKDRGLANGSYPVAEKVAGEILSLPMFPGLTPDQIRYVASKIHAFYKQ